MNKEQLYYFIKVVDSGSINKASEELFVSQPSLSRAIQSLENEIGKTLVTRTNKGINITPAGKTMYFYAQSITNQFQMIERLKTLQEEHLYTNLTVSIANIFLSDFLILSYYKQNNALDSEINFYETTAEETLNNIINRKCEIGVLVVNDTQFGVFHKLCDLKNLEIEILGESPLYVHANKALFPNTQKIINATSLLDKTYVHSPVDFYSNLNTSINVDSVNIHSFAKTITTSNYHTLLNMIKNNPAFLLGHKWQIEELNKSNIKSYLVENSPLVKRLVIVQHKKEELSTGAKIFVDLIKDYYTPM